MKGSPRNNRDGELDAWLALAFVVFGFVLVVTVFAALAWIAWRVLTWM